MAKDFSEIYEAMRIADEKGNADDVAKLAAYLEAESAKAHEEETYDPKKLVSPMAFGGAGAGGASIGPAIVKKGMESIKAANAPKPTVTTGAAPGSALADIEEAMTKGLSNEVTQQTRTAQRAARTEHMGKVLAELKAQGVPVNPNVLAEMPTQVARPGSGILLNAEKAKELAAAEDAAKAAQAAANAPKASKLANMANFIKGAVDYRIPFTQIHTGPLLGRGLVGAGSGLQFADMLNRHEMGDTAGSVISGIGGLGTAASLLPFLPAKVVGTGVGLSAEAINAYRDAMRRGRVEHTMPGDYGRVDAMGNAYAQGGLVHLAKGGDPHAPWNQKVVPNPEDLMGTFSYAPGYYGEVADRINPEGQSAGVNDALRHMLAAGDIARRVNAPIRASGLSSITPGGIPLVSENVGPAVARGLGAGHEMMNYLQNIGGKKPQTNEDLAQDLYNNALGAQLGGTATSFQDLINKMPAAINVRPYQKEKGKALIRHPDEVGTPYKPFKWF